MERVLIVKDMSIFLSDNGTYIVTDSDCIQQNEFNELMHAVEFCEAVGEGFNYSWL